MTRRVLRGHRAARPIAAQSTNAAANRIGLKTVPRPAILQLQAPPTVAWCRQRLELPGRLTQHCRAAGIYKNAKRRVRGPGTTVEDDT